MLTRRQIEVIGRAIEAREATIVDDGASTAAVLEELSNLQEIKAVLAQMYNDQAEVDADDLGEMYTWSVSEYNKYGSQPEYRLFMTFGKLMGKIEAGYVTEEDWAMLQQFKAWLP